MITTTAIYQALLAAQRAFGPVVKNAKNPAFKSSYATLDAVLDAIAGPLNDHGLLVVQRLDYDPESLAPLLRTELIHAETGQQLSSAVPIACKDPSDPQKIGGAITYYRRYSLLALLGLSPEDDDGHAASQPSAAAKGEPAPRGASYPSRRSERDPLDAPQTRPAPRSATNDATPDVDIPSPFAAVGLPPAEFAVERALLAGMVKDGLAESDIVKAMNAVKPKVSKAQFTELRVEYKRHVAERGGSPPAVSQPSTAAQRIAIRSLLDLKRVPEKAVEEYAVWQFGELGPLGPEFAELTRDQADAVLGWLKREASRNPAHGLAKVAT